MCGLGGVSSLGRGWVFSFDSPIRRPRPVVFLPAAEGVAAAVFLHRLIILSPTVAAALVSACLVRYDGEVISARTAAACLLCRPQYFRIWCLSAFGCEVV